MTGSQDTIVRAAFATWNHRIAPQFDAARHAYIVEVRCGAVVDERLEALRIKLPVHKVRRLVELGVGTLVCGAISRPIQALLAAHSIMVVPFVAGELSEVLHAWIEGRLREGLYAMPGHHGGQVQAERP